MRRKIWVIMLVCTALLVGFASCGVREVTCTQCQGTGKCNFCNGSGKDYAHHDCGTCKGSGRCYRCQGSGVYKY